MKQLSDFTIGERGVVKMVDGDRRIRRRLFDMGVKIGHIHIEGINVLEPDITLWGFQGKFGNQECIVDIIHDRFAFDLVG